MRFGFAVSEVGAGHGSPLEVPGSPGLTMENGVEISLCAVNLPSLQHCADERCFSVSAPEAFGWGSRVFAALWHGFLLPVGTHK